VDQGAARLDRSAGARTVSGIQRFTRDHVAAYARDGLLFLEALFSPAEIRAMGAEVGRLLSERTERTVFEVDGKTIRSVYGIHHHGLFANLARHPRIIEPVRAVLGTDVYLYQSKLNTKSVFGGDVWPWHQDYPFWLYEDAMPAPRALTVAVFLDDVTEVSGPVAFIPGSHRNGIVETETYEGRPPGYDESPEWISHVVARLKYRITKRAFVELARTNGIVTPTGATGSVVLFDCNVAHASSLNLSPYDRRVALFTYNAVGNAPDESSLRRPEFLVSRDRRPVAPVADDVLLPAVVSVPADAS
jgi:L-proline 4-hydroxylase